MALGGGAVQGYDDMASNCMREYAEKEGLTCATHRPSWDYILSSLEYTGYPEISANIGLIKYYDNVKHCLIMYIF